MKQTVASLLVLSMWIWVSPACKQPKPERADAQLTFVHDGKTLRTFSLADLKSSIPTVVVTAFDPSYAKQKTFRALDLHAVLEKGFAGENVDLGVQEYILRAGDGYASTLSGAIAIESGGYIAYEDVDVAGWEPVGQPRMSPGPFYVVWSKSEQANIETHPRPWQLTTIEMSSFATAFPHLRPPTENESATRGYQAFRTHCVRCHAINREGGHVGPDLNVPQNILEYRPESQVRSYIKNPLLFRYGNMPPQSVTDSELDDLIAYFGAMKNQKHDEH